MSKRRTHWHTIPSPNDDKLQPYRWDGNERIDPRLFGRFDHTQPVLLVVAPSAERLAAFVDAENLNSHQVWGFSTISRAFTNARWARANGIRATMVILPSPDGIVPV